PEPRGRRRAVAALPATAGGGRRRLRRGPAAAGRGGRLRPVPRGGAPAERGRGEPAGGLKRKAMRPLSVVGITVVRRCPQWKRTCPRSFSVSPVRGQVRSHKGRAPRQQSTQT